MPRSASSRAGSGSESAVTRWTAASCSTTGPPRSMVVRAAAKRWISGSLARIQPVRSPAQWDLLSEPIETTAGAERRHPPCGRCVKVEFPQCFIHNQHGAGRSRGPDQPPALGIGHQPARRVVEVRHHVRHGRPQLQQGGLQRVKIPARTRGHGHRHGPAAGGADGIEGVRVGGVFHEDFVCPAGEGPQHNVQGMLRAGGHEDLVRGGGHALGRIPGRDRGPQRAHPEGVVAEAGQQGRELRQRGGKGAVHHFAARRQRRVRQIEEAVRNGQARRPAERG